MARIEEEKRMQDTQWMKIDEAAKCIGISAGTLRNWVWQHKIPHFKIGGLVRFRRSELEAWIEDALVPVDGSIIRVKYGDKELGRVHVE
jgi:excisionase family DNA binding protein